MTTITPKTTRWGGKTSPSMFPRWARAEELLRGAAHCGRVSCDHVIMFRRLELQPGLDLQQRGRPLLTCGDVTLIWILWAESPAASCQSMQTISYGGAEPPTGPSVKETWITLCCDWSAASNRLFRICLLFWTNDEESKSFQTAEGSTANVRFLKNVWFRFYCQFYLYV